MNIQILQLLEGARAATGLAVIIDVFRAFTVETYLMERNARRIHPVGDVQTAFDYRAAHPDDTILCGERNGIMIEGFDFGNSPSQLETVDLTGKTVIHTTSAGTQGIAGAVNAREIITGSLVNAAAIAEYIRRQNPDTASLVCMGLHGQKETDEDTLCAEYIKSLLEENPIDMTSRIEALKYTSGAKFFDQAQQDVFPEADFHICTQLDKFDFTLRLKTGEDGLGYMEKVSPHGGSAL